VHDQRVRSSQMLVKLFRIRNHHVPAGLMLEQVQPRHSQWFSNKNFHMQPFVEQAFGPPA
jgi:hypothetical protein